MAKERLHLVLMQDRANVSADFLELMKQEIIEVIKKYIDVDESSIDVRMTNKQNEDGTNGAPALYANIPIVNIKDDILREKNKEQQETENYKDKEEQNVEDKKNEGTDKQENIEEKEEQKENGEKTEDKNEPIEEEKKTETVSKEGL